MDAFIIPKCKVIGSTFRSILRGSAGHTITAGKVVIAASTKIGIFPVKVGTFNLDLCQPDSARSDQGVELHLSGAQPSCPVAAGGEWSVDIDILIEGKLPVSILNVEVKAFDQNDNEFMCMKMGFDIKKDEIMTCTPDNIQLELIE